MSRIIRPPLDQVGESDFVGCRGGLGSRSRTDPRLEQDMEAELEADVEYFDHPTLGRIRLRDHLVATQVEPEGLEFEIP